MKNYALLFGMLGLLGRAVDSVGQNLVPNPSFEQFTFCPVEGNDFIDNVESWSRCPGTPDYFNECAETIPYDVPSNRFGYQWAADGSGYAGLVTCLSNGARYREFIYATLETPLIVGTPVHLSMKVALGAYGTELPPVGWTSKGIGMKLTTQPFQWGPETPFPNTAQLYLNEVLEDTLNWVTLSATYLPDSAYQYVTIGNFFEDSLSTPLALDTNGLGFAYVYIDMICVASEETACALMNEVQSSVNGVDCMVANPFADRLEVFFGAAFQEPLQVTLYNEQGALCFRRTIPPGQQSITWNSVALKDGVYVMAFVGQDTFIKPKRLVKITP